MSVRWEPLVGPYRVSDDGRVMNTLTGKTLTPRPRNGYLRVQLQKALIPEGAPQMVPLHRAVLEAFAGPRPTPRHHGAHLDGDRTNNRADNLAWKLPEDNEADKKRHGTSRGGVGRRLPRRVQLRIASRVAQGESRTRVAQVYGLHRSSVARIARRVAA